MVFRRAFLLLISVAQIALATTITNFDPLHLFRCTFSSRHHNRIVVQNGRIATVVVPEGNITANLEETSGQLFINALHPNPPVTTISVVTESGEVQDLEIEFEDIQSETLVLTPIFEGEFLCENSCSPVSREQAVSSVIDSILSGKIPCGFMSSSDGWERRLLKKNIVAEITGKLISDREIVYIWKVTNKSFFYKNVYFSDFQFLNPSWVYIDKHQIGGISGKQTIAIVGVSLL